MFEEIEPLFGDGKEKKDMIEHRTLNKKIQLNNPVFPEENFKGNTGMKKRISEDEQTNVERFMKHEKINNGESQQPLKSRPHPPVLPESNLQPQLPKEFYQISPIIKNLYLSGKHGEQFYKNYDVIINLNYPENNAPKGCLLVDKAKVYRLGIEDSHMEDLYTYFDILSALILTSLKNNKKVLVHCHAGISRSVSIIMAFFIKFGKVSVKDAYFKVKEKRSIAGPNEGFLKQLEYYSKNR